MPRPCIAAQECRLIRVALGALLVGSLLQEAAIAAPEAITCRNGPERHVISVVRKGNAPLPCAVRYKREPEGVDETPWRAANDPTYCARKVNELSESLVNAGWQCDSAPKEELKAPTEIITDPREGPKAIVCRNETIYRHPISVVLEPSELAELRVNEGWECDSPIEERRDVSTVIAVDLPPVPLPPAREKTPLPEVAARPPVVAEPPAAALAPRVEAQQSAQNTSATHVEKVPSLRTDDARRVRAPGYSDKRWIFGRDEVRIAADPRMRFFSLRYGVDVIAETLEVELIDLNDDSSPEIFVRVGLAGACGEKPCSWQLYTIDPELKLATLGVLGIREWRILPTRTATYRDLWLAFDDGVESIARFSENTGMYQQDAATGRAAGT